MLALMIRRNGIEASDVASVTFTVTKDLGAEFPALAARQLGWIDVPLLCSYEISVPVARSAFALVHWNTDKTQRNPTCVPSRRWVVEARSRQFPPVD